MNSFSIGQLQAFLWTAEFNSVQKAANHLNLTQPSLSNRLKQLESEVAVPLFEKHGRGLRLTRYGQLFLARTRVVLSAYDDLKHFTQQPEIAGSLRIGVAEGFAVACMAELIGALRDNFPLLRPEWTVATSPGMEQQIANGELDIAILVEPIGLKGVRFNLLGMQDNSWAIARQLYPESSATPTDLSRITIVTTPSPTAMYRASLGWFAEQNLTPQNICVCSSLNAALQLVAAGLGAGIFPSQVVAADPRSPALHQLQTTPKLNPSRVYVADRTTSDEIQTQAILRVIEKVSHAVGYFMA